MGVFYRLVMSSVCRSNHHRLAIEALPQLKGPHAALWHDLLLHHHKEYLEGAKAPDEVFKDFKNHVLHVREGDWGGAPQAAREWYRRTVRALVQKDWPHAAYCAGVMSHYIVDPVQPFHTGQTEEENTIHRAVEWSFSKSYDTLRRILDQDLGGYPDVPVPSGDDWLEQMVKAGAKTSNVHYETVVNHYNFALGVKKPEAGLDQELKDIVARLIGYATVLLARVLDRAFAEAAVVPPKVGLMLDTLVAGIQVPIRSVLKSIDNAKEKALVASMYEEFRKTGKLRKTLPHDDKIVRALHAAEVLRMPLSNLDAQWPRETGTAFRTGTPARQTPKPVKKAKAKPATRIEPKPAARPETAKATPPTAAKALTRDRLSPDDPIVDAPSIGPKTAARFAAIGLHKVKDLLSISPENAAMQINLRHINARTIRDWQSQAELACSIPNITSLAAQLLVAVGVRDADQLMNADPDTLVNLIEEYCETAEGQRTLRDAGPPTREDIDEWIEAAHDAIEREAA
jgi:predicted flap endonuclease-1-like 5' DNA nuclease